jgi:hypothetical protein
MKNKKRVSPIEAARSPETAPAFPPEQIPGDLLPQYVYYVVICDSF